MLINQPKDANSSDQPPSSPKYPYFSMPRAVAFAFIVLIMLGISASPLVAQAGLFSFFSTNQSSGETGQSHNSQTIPLPEAATGPEFGLDARGGAELAVDNGALVTEAGPLGTSSDNTDIPNPDEISLYVVKPGDSLGVIAKMFGVSVNTIRWANNISVGQSPKVGDTLLILSISGISYTVQKGDTLKSIAKKFKSDSGEISTFNGIAPDAALAIGDKVIIPDAEIATPAASTPSSGSNSGSGKGQLPKYAYGPTRLFPGSNTGPDLGDYFLRPINGGVISQGLHEMNAVDIAAPRGTAVHAAADGIVIMSRNSGWNGGYGNVVAISHSNGTETLYAHMLRTNVEVGEQVARGQTIGYIGMTGRTTGPHVHFEVRHAQNPLGKNSNYTGE